MNKLGPLCAYALILATSILTSCATAGLPPSESPAYSELVGTWDVDLEQRSKGWTTTKVEITRDERIKFYDDKGSGEYLFSVFQIEALNERRFFLLSEYASDGGKTGMKVNGFYYQWIGTKLKLGWESARDLTLIRRK